MISATVNQEFESDLDLSNGKVLIAIVDLYGKPARAKGR